MTGTQWRSITSEKIDKALHVFHERRIVDLYLENTLLRYWSRLLLEAFLEVECRFEGRNQKEWTRNGYAIKKVYTPYGHIRCNCPRDRENQFRSFWLESTQGVFQTVNAKLIALFTQGLSWPQAQKIMAEFFMVPANRQEGIWERMRVLWGEMQKNWWSRPFLREYACVVWYEWMLPVSDEDGIVRSRSYCAAVALHYGGVSEVLGVWQTPKTQESWARLYADLVQRGLKTVAMEYVFTHATSQRKASWRAWGAHWAHLSPVLFAQKDS